MLDAREGQLIRSDKAKTGYKGVTAVTGRYHAKCQTSPCRLNHLGTFDIPEDAAQSYLQHQQEEHPEELGMKQAPQLPPRHVLLGQVPSEAVETAHVQLAASGAELVETSPSLLSAQEMVGRKRKAGGNISDDASTQGKRLAMAAVHAPSMMSIQASDHATISDTAAYATAGSMSDPPPQAGPPPAVHLQLSAMTAELTLQVESHIRNVERAQRGAIEYFRALQARHGGVPALSSCPTGSTAPAQPQQPRSTTVPTATAGGDEARQHASAEWPF